MENIAHKNITNKYVVFDWDGTLHDTKRLYAEAVRRAYMYLDSNADYATSGFVHKQPEELTEEALARYLGMTAKQMWDDFMPDLDAEYQVRAEKIVGDSMVELVAGNNRTRDYSGPALYNKVEELLNMLKRKKYNMIILSNCKIAYLEAHRQVWNLDKWFIDYYPAQKYDFIPKEEILKQVMDKYPGEYVMIGDRANDIYAGKMCEVKTIGCAYGFGSFEELKDADIIVESVDELMNQF